MITTAHGIVLGELLADDLLTGVEVLAGAGAGPRVVTGVRTIDVPEAAERILPGELLVLTSAGLVDRIAGCLAQRRPAGVAVRLGPELPQIPDTLREAAEEMDIAVLSLPRSLAHDDLMLHGINRLNAHQGQVLERIDALHEGLSQLVLAGGDLTEISSHVARVLGVGIMVTSTDGREQAGAITDEHRDLLDEHQLLDPTGRIRVERARDTAALESGEMRVTRIAAGGTDLAWLVCVSPERRLASDDIQSLERAGTVAALLITREHAIMAVENKYRGDFLRDIFLGRAGSAEFILEHAETFGWKLDRPMVVISAEIDAERSAVPVPSPVSRAWQERFSAAWNQVCRARDSSIPSADFSSEVVTLFPAPVSEEGPDEEALRDLVAGAVSAVAGDRGGGRRPFSVGISRIVDDLAHLPAAYNQARRATQVGRRISGGKSTTWFDDLGLHRLIALVPDEDELQAFAEDVLGDLAAQNEEAVELRTTLQFLLDTNFNVAQAARLQFFHYNTMRYRVGKLERTLGPLTTNPHLRLNVAVALQVLEMTGSK
ncbi:MAG: helix-turn-helix domain-containing protein [Nocardioides sp.]|nr:helix-turn-helix domain-containing protein [Nocardioides sp.]